MRCIRFLFFVLLSCVALYLPAQPSVVMRFDSQRLRPTDSMEVVYSIYDAPATSLIPPQFAGWRILRGPWKRNISVTENGLTQQVAEVHYMLQPARSGQLLIPAAAVRYQGQLTMSNYASVEVVDQGSTTGIPDFSYDAYVARPGEDLKRKLTDNTFLRIRTNKQTLYEGESLVAEYLLYARVSLEASVTKRPGFNGFSSIDLKFDTSSAGFTTEVYKGKVYRVFGVRKVQLAALRTGSLKLDAFEVEARANFAIYEDGFTGYGAERVVQQNALLRSNEPAINVLPLPAKNKPANMNGAVGAFTLSTQVVGANNAELTVGQKAEFIVSISGSGHWREIREPQIAWPEGLNAFAPLITESLDSQQVPVAGVRNFHFPFVPSNTGNYIIPGVAFSYFNTATKRYETLQSAAVSFEVKRAPLKQSLRRVSENLGSPASYFLWGLITLIVLAVLYVFLRRTTAEKQNPLEEKRPYGFHGQVLQAYLHHVLQNEHWQQEEAIKMKELLENFLRNEEINSEQQQLSNALIAHCNKWVYAPEGTSPADADDVMKLLRRLSDSLH